MRVLMLETRRGCDDGFRTDIYHENHIYSVSDHLARQFISRDHAREATTRDEINFHD